MDVKPGKGRYEARPLHIVGIVLLLALTSLRLFGNTRPVEVKQDVRSRTESVNCSECKGKGFAYCPRCGGSTSVAAGARCPLCNGTGRHKWELGGNVNAPCQRCHGTGTVAVRNKCTYCGQTGQIRCQACSGSGKGQTTVETNVKTVMMGYSLWERFLRFFGLPIEENPSPQSDSRGRYPLIQKYVAVQPRSQGAIVTQWGDFRPSKGMWLMRARMSLPGSTTARNIEFTVRNRTVVGATAVQ